MSSKAYEFDIDSRGRGICHATCPTCGDVVAQYTMVSFRKNLVGIICPDCMEVLDSWDVGAC